MRSRSRASSAAGVETVLLLLLSAALGFFAIENLDIFLHLRTGEWIVQNGLLHENRFSFVYPDRPYVDDKWLFQVLIHLAHRGVDFSGLVVVRWIAVMALALLLIKAAGAGRRTPYGLVILGLAVVASYRRFLLRPELISYLFLVVQAHLILRRRRRGFGVLLGWFAVQVVWTNLHGYFVLGPALFAAALGGSLLGRLAGTSQGAHPWDLARLLGVSLLGCCVHAYGMAGTLHPLVILQDLRAHYEFYSQNINEFLPTFAYREVRGTDFLCYVLLLVALGLTVVVRRRRCIGPGLGMVILTAAQSLTLIRNMPLFALTAAPFLAREGAAFLQGLPKQRGLARWPLRVLAWGALSVPLLLTLTGKLYLHDRHERRMGLGLNPTRYPEREVSALERMGFRGRIGNAFGAGGYLLYRLRPPEGVLIDGNTDGYPVEHLEWHSDLFAGVLDATEEADRRGIDAYYSEWEHGLSMQLWQDERWLPVEAGKRGIVFLRSDSQLGRQMQDRDLRESLRRNWLPDVLPGEREVVPVYPAPLRRAALFFLNLREVSVAERLLRQLPDDLARLYEFEVMKGLLLLEKGEPREALACLDRAANRNARSFLVLTTRAPIFKNLREYELANQDLQRAAGLRPDSTEVQLGLADLADKLGRREARLSHLRRAADLSPGRYEVVFALLHELSWSPVPAHRDELHERLEALAGQDLPRLWRSDLEDLRTRFRRDRAAR